jgi:hypothetical protein
MKGKNNSMDDICNVGAESHAIKVIEDNHRSFMQSCLIGSSVEAQKMAVVAISNNWRLELHQAFPPFATTSW